MMASRINYIVSLVFILSSCFAQTSALFSKESVPVLIWSNQRQPLDIPAVSAIPIPFTHVEGKYLKSFNQNSIILFLQDTMSVEDLSSHEDVFKNVDKYMEKGHSLYLPAVEIGTSLTHSYSSHGYNIITLEPGSAIGEVKLKSGSPNLVLVKLPSTTTNPSRQKALQKTDEIIGNVMSKIGKLADFTVLYTGIEPSVKLESRVEHRRSPRAVKANEGDDINFFDANCIIMYLRNGIEIQKENTSYVLPNNKSHDDPVADCRPTTNFVQLSYKDLDDHQKVKVKIGFVRVNRYWTFDFAELSEMVNGQLSTISLKPDWQMEYIPLNKSYACSKKLVFSSNSTDTLGAPNTKLIITGMQVQAFAGSQRKFDDAWDCVGFFTIPIWMGIFTGMILTLILLIGMLMLMDIKTMDRFDDPKGKHFVIAANE